MRYNCFHKEVFETDKSECDFVQPDKEVLVKIWKKVPDLCKRDEWDMGSNLSRQSERKEEKREDFAVYDAQNYRKLCEKYMLVNYIEIHFGLNVG